MFRKIKYYESIKELPIERWFKLAETNDLRWLLKEKKQRLRLRESVKLQGAYELIYQEYMNKFGVNEQLIRVMELKRDIAVLKLDMAINEDPTRETFIDIKEAELKVLMDGNNKSNSINMKAYIEKYMGFYLDTKVITVEDFYSYMEIIDKENKQAEKNGRPN